MFQRRVIGINELLNFELFDDDPKQFDDAWEKILKPLEKEREDALLQGLCLRYME